MSTAEMEERKRLIIQEIQLVEEEWILKAIEKLLDMDDEMGKHLLGSFPNELEQPSSILTEDDWLEIERDDEDFSKGIGTNHSWEEVRTKVLKEIE